MKCNLPPLTKRNHQLKSYIWHIIRQTLKFTKQVTCNICRYKKNLHKKRQTGSKNLASCLRTDNKKMYILSSENEMLAGLFLPSVSLFLFISFLFYFYINLPHHNISVYLNRHIYVCAHFVFLFLSISVYLSLSLYITVYLNQYIYFYVHISLFLFLFSFVHLSM